MIKRLTALVLAGGMAAVLFAACSNNDTPLSVSTPQTSGSTSAGNSDSSFDNTVALQEVEGMRDTFLGAANIEQTIPVTELDLSSGGITLDNVVAFAGGEAINSADNGGIVIVIHAVSGTADTVKKELEAFRDSRISDAYAEFATAMENTRQARIVSNGDFVLYAVSATGHEGGYDQLDAAIKDAQFS